MACYAMHDATLIHRIYYLSLGLAGAAGGLGLIGLEIRYWHVLAVYLQCTEYGV